MSKSNEIKTELEALRSILDSTNLFETSLRCSKSELSNETVLKFEITVTNNLLSKAAICFLTSMYQLGEIVELYKFARIGKTSPTSMNDGEHSPEQHSQCYIEVSLKTSYEDDRGDDCPRAAAFLEVIGRFSYFVEKHILPLQNQLKDLEASKSSFK